MLLKLFLPFRFANRCLELWKLIDAGWQGIVWTSKIFQAVSLSVYTNPWTNSGKALKCHNSLGGQIYFVVFFSYFGSSTKFIGTELFIVNWGISLVWWSFEWRILPVFHKWEPWFPDISPWNKGFLILGA